MFYWLTQTIQLQLFGPFMFESIQHCGEQRSVCLGRWNSVCGSRAPAKELGRWANMGLGFRRTTHRASETQISERGELRSLWTYQFLCEICERVMSAVSTICRHHAIQWGYEVACEFVKIFSFIMQCKGNKESWHLMNEVRWETESLIMARDYRGTCHFIDFTCKKRAHFWIKRSMIKLEYFQTLSDPMWQVLHHRVTYRAVIPKIGHILSPSDHANQMAGEKPQPQFDNLESKIGFNRPCSGLRIQTYWSNRVNNWRGQLNGENMSWIKQLALERGNIYSWMVSVCSWMLDQGQITHPAQTMFDSHPSQPHPAPCQPPNLPWSISKAEEMQQCNAKQIYGGKISSQPLDR